jgi:hypothetical protein
MAPFQRAPIGSKRKHDSGYGIYWVVKVAHSKRWQYEHRVIMERLLGRKLKTKEHVHHRNHDTLDNSEENLTILTSADHARQHHVLQPSQWAKDHVACLKCRTTTRKHLALGFCVACYQRQPRVHDYQYRWHKAKNAQ